MAAAEAGAWVCSACMRDKRVNCESCLRRRPFAYVTDDLPKLPAISAEVRKSRIRRRRGGA